MIGAMDLTDYISKKGGTATLGCPVVAEIAAKADCSPGTLYMIAKGHKSASAKLASRIEAATDGQVPRGGLRPDVFGAVQKGEAA
jgi:DNA-binding transcriptional regulator YdaS (Cro superfamily)